MKALHNVHLFVLIIIICGILSAPVNAKDDNSTYVGMKNGKTVALDAKSIHSPHLQFKNTQQYVKITGEMSQKGKSIPAEISKNIAVAQNDVMQTLSETTIPDGAIIHHSPSGVTTIFDANGNQLFAAKDADAKKMATPFGSVPITFVNEVPNNSIIYNDNNGTIHVFYNDTRILTITNNTNYGISDSHISSSGTPVSGQACISNGYPIQYIEGAETQFIPSVGQFTA
jgi:H2-forming N5,N10-methylenetetrahydromethanopterin dehydrogenase-like enzyme